MFNKGKFIFTVLTVVFLALTFTVPAFAQSVTLEVNPVNTAAEGDEVTLTATNVDLPGVDVGDLEYRFAYRKTGAGNTIYFPYTGPSNSWSITVPEGAAGNWDLGVQVREAGTNGWSAPPVNDIVYSYEITEVADDPDPEHTITNVSFTPPTPDTLEFDENVNFTFDYSTTNPGDVQIWGRPMTEGSLSLNWGGHGSPHHSPPAGSASGVIRIRDVGQTDAQHVDQVRFRMVCVDTSDILLETFVDVDYTYVPPGFDHDFGSDRDGLEGWEFKGTWTQTPSQLHTNGDHNKWSSAWYTIRDYRNFEYTVVMRSGVSPGDRSQPQYLVIRAGDQLHPTTRSWYPGYSFGYYQPDMNYYSIWKRYPDSTDTALATWTATAEIVDGWNTLKVIALDNRFDFYINDTLVETVFDPEFTVGKVGFTMFGDEGRFSVHRATLTVIADGPG